MDRLTKRDLGILALLGKGLPDAEVCRSLGISALRVEAAVERMERHIERGRANEGERVLFEMAVRKRLENALRATQVRFSALLDSVLAAVLVVDGRTGLIKQANLRSEDLFGYPLDALVGRQIEDLVPTQHRALHPAYRIGFLTSIRKREMGYHPPIHALRGDGKLVELAIALTATPLDDDVMVVCSEYSLWVSATNEAAAGRPMGR